MEKGDLIQLHADASCNNPVQLDEPSKPGVDLKRGKRHNTTKAGSDGKRGTEGVSANVGRKCGQG